MLVSIIPIQSSFKFGTADTLLIKSNQDDLVDSATFFWQLGKMVTPDEGSDVFDGDELAIGNASLIGDAYRAWSGANADLPKRVVSQIGVTLA